MSKLKEKAVEILKKAFPDWEVEEEDIIPVSGFWKKVDVYRWQVVCDSKNRYSNGDKITVNAGCWETLSQFVQEASKFGCYLNNNEIWIGARK